MTPTAETRAIGPGPSHPGSRTKGLMERCFCIPHSNSPLSPLRKTPWAAYRTAPNISAKSLPLASVMTKKTISSTTHLRLDNTRKRSFVPGRGKKICVWARTACAPGPGPVAQRTTRGSSAGSSQVTLPRAQSQAPPNPPRSRWACRLPEEPARQATPPTTWLRAIGHLPRGGFKVPAMQRTWGTG